LQSVADPQLGSAAATAGEAVSDEAATAAALTVTELIDDLDDILI
jgi:hypothetical protein